MKKLALVCLFCSVLLVGCKDVKIEKSEVLHEKAEVIKLVYTPSTHDLEPMITTTIDSEGYPSIETTFITVSVPEKYAVVFKCQHGEFIIQGAGERYKALFKKLTEGEQVDVTYHEVFRSTYDKGELVKKELIDYDFLDANPV